MRSVRCEVCGTKALLAATQCPHCGHELNVRDGFGELLPLVHCSTCDSDYPARQGRCIWCGTKAEGVRLGPYIWKTAAGFAFAALLVAAWAANRSGARQEVSGAGAIAVNDAPPAAVATDTARDDDSVATVLPDSAVVEAAPPSLSDTANLTAAFEAPRDARMEEAPSAPPAARAAAPASPRRSNRWVATVARDWITVRASATHASRLVASIGPDTRVQFGERRGEWVRVRTQGISGWTHRPD